MTSRGAVAKRLAAGAHTATRRRRPRQTGADVVLLWFFSGMICGSGAGLALGALLSSRAMGRIVALNEQLRVQNREIRDLGDSLLADVLTEMRGIESTLVEMRRVDDVGRLASMESDGGVN